MYHAGRALGFSLVGAAPLFAAARPPWAWYTVTAAWLAAVNVVTFAYYGHDKAPGAGRAGRGCRKLCSLGLRWLGGMLGAYLGMATFRHKTVKATFRLVFWLIAALQVLLVVAVIYRLWAGQPGAPARALSVPPSPPGERG